LWWSIKHRWDLDFLKINSFNTSRRLLIFFQLWFLWEKKPSSLSYDFRLFENEYIKKILSFFFQLWLLWKKNQLSLLWFIIHLKWKQQHHGQGPFNDHSENNFGIMSAFTLCCCQKTTINKGHCSVYTN
jgi:hypothetical protein